MPSRAATKSSSSGDCSVGLRFLGLRGEPTGSLACFPNTASMWSCRARSGGVGEGVGLATLLVHSRKQQTFSVWSAPAFGAGLPCCLAPRCAIPPSFLQPSLPRFPAIERSKIGAWTVSARPAMAHMQTMALQQGTQWAFRACARPCRGHQLARAAPAAPLQRAVRRGVPSLRCGTPARPSRLFCGAAATERRQQSGAAEKQLGTAIRVALQGWPAGGGGAGGGVCQRRGAGDGGGGGRGACAPLSALGKAHALQCSGC